MNFTYFIPTKLIFGRECIRSNGSIIAGLGKKAFIATGARSASVNGSLQDMTGMLEELGMDYCHFNRVEANPSVETVAEAAEILKRENCDFVIGIGGGSPMDAAKAIAVLGNNDISIDEMFNGNFPNDPLPVVAVPTTAGTGSEATPYSILTYRQIQNKKNLSSEKIYPALSFLDPKYTEFLPLHTTVNTAVDALSHAVEGFFSRRAIPAIKPLALEAMSILGHCLKELASGMEPTAEDRDNLLYASMLAGMVIAHTGTTCVHAMGYPLTFFRNIDHGRANGLLMTEYLRFLEPQRHEVKEVLSSMKLKSLDGFRELMDALLKEKEALSEDELKLFVETAMTSKSIGFTDPVPDASRVREMFEKSFLQDK